MRRATAVAATASGGATTAPMAKAAGQPTLGSRVWTTAATTTVVTITSRIDRRRMVPRLALKSTSEVCSAVV